jgi:hypothetical protein
VNLPIIRRESWLVLSGPDKHSRPHFPKTTAIFKAYTATYQKIFRCMIFQSTTSVKNRKKHNVWGGILSFFLFLLSISGLNRTKIFKIKLDLFHSILLLLTTTFTATNYSPKIIFFIRPVLSYLAVATATWQH